MFITKIFNVKIVFGLLLILACVNCRIRIADASEYLSDKTAPRDLAGDFSFLKIQDVKPLHGKEKSWYAPPHQPNYSLSIKNGNIYKNDKPFFMLGSPQGGGGRWDTSTHWWPRIFKHDFVELYVGANKSMIVKNTQDTLNIGFKDTAYSYTHLNELAKNNTFVWLDIGTVQYRYLPSLIKYRNKFPELKKIMDPRWGHFHPFDLANPTSHKLYKAGWKSYFKFYKGLPILSVELFNELGYESHSPLTLHAFREYMLDKYKSLGKMNKTLHTDFRAKEEIAPAHIWPSYYKKNLHPRRIKKIARADYPELHHDWLEFLRHFLIKNLKIIKNDFKAVSKERISIDARNQRVIPDHYSVLDPQLLADNISDIYAFHSGKLSMLNKNGSSLKPDEVMSEIMKICMHRDFIRTEVPDKPIVDPELILKGTRSFKADLDFMVDNSIVKLDRKWKFKTDPNKNGITEKWYAENYNDSAWDSLSVPEMWQDLDRIYKKYKGLAWYRIKFKMPSGYEQGHRDGSTKYLLYGKGVHDSGIFYLNGEKIGSFTGWNTEYSIDVSEVLRYGKENTLSVSVSGKAISGGRRFFMTLIPDTALSKEESLNKAQMAAILWSYVVHGMSGLDIWYWQEIINTFVPEIKNNIDNVSDVLMPRPRIKGKIALLYPYETFRGLFLSTKEAKDYMEYYSALFFGDTPFDIISPKRLLKIRNDQYPLIILPYNYYIRHGTFEKLKGYIESGGIAIINYDSFKKDDLYYKEPQINKLIGIETVNASLKGASILYNGKKYPVQRGNLTKKYGVYIQNKSANIISRYETGEAAIVRKNIKNGKIYFIGAELNFFAMHTILNDILENEKIRSPFKVSCKSKDEFPYVEKQIIGDQDRFLLYFVNWGGKDKKIFLKLTKEFLKDTSKKYYIRNVQDSKWKNNNKLVSAKTLMEGVDFNIPVQMPQVFLFESSPSQNRIQFKKLSPKRDKILKMFDKIQSTPFNKEGAKKALFLKQPLKKASRLIGKCATPLITQLLMDNGYDIFSIQLSDINYSNLKKYALFILSEDDSLNFQGFKRKQRSDAIIRFIKDGGNLLLIGSASVDWNARNIVINNILKDYGIKVKLGFCKNPNFSGNGDPVQIRISKFQNHAVTKYINELQFFACSVLSGSSSAFKPIAFTQSDDIYFPSQPVILAGELGKGKIVIVTDNSWAQPFRVEQSDNLQFLMNIINWFNGKKIEKYDKLKMINNLFINEKLVKAMEKEEK